ncbi:MAG: DNA helicase RecQ [Dehalococcoidia bacterium]|nr:DNA helicase RecQ [Dehalococcoidia bacterium]
MSLLPALKQHFGFTSFRPLQEEIIRDALASRDVFALLPTGGGKSLCFQLPAVMRPGLTIVVSPLIALMKDQVDALQANGIPATFLNSSLLPEESRVRLRDLHKGRYRLLYVAPERLMLTGFLNDLHTWNPVLIAIDEAHCISEWGHDFRPEYRQLSQLRTLFPHLPLMALTATATERVRDDIVKILGLRNPHRYVASFNRPNLTYRVLAKSKPLDQTLALIRRHPHEHGIVYCASRTATERVAEHLNNAGITAKPYHAGLTSQQRTEHQDLFLRDEVQVICATIAFGMGINKSNIRFVLHYDLPKSIEGYYQETGRAGRDGLPSECALLFNPGDVVKQKQFINEKPDAKEREIAGAQLQQMVHYAESAACRRGELLRYFGETFAAIPCNGCDNCLSPRATYDGTKEAQKFLSCALRIRQKGGFSVGMTHIVEVLTGADTERIRKWRHNELSTYAIGKDHSRPEWSAIGRELVRLGYLRLTESEFSVLEVTESGNSALRDRSPILLTTSPTAPQQKGEQASVPAHDDALFARLRQLRKTLADQRGVPAYIVFSDAALRQMAQAYPETKQQFSRISSVGAKKLEEFGAVFLNEIVLHLQASPRQTFPPSVQAHPTANRKGNLSNTVMETLRLFQAGHPIEQIAAQRGLAQTTIYGHLADAIEHGASLDPNQFWTAAQRQRIADAFTQSGPGNLTGAKELAGDDISFGLLRIYRAFQRAGPGE